MGSQRVLRVPAGNPLLKGLVWGVDRQRREPLRLPLLPGFRPGRFMISSLTLVLALATHSASAAAPLSLDDAPQEKPVLELTFGIYQTDKATTLYRQFTPTLELLQDAMEVDLERPVDIQLRIYKTYDEGIAALATGDIDFVRFGPAAYITAHARQPYVQLLAMELKDRKKRSRGVIVVRSDSESTILADLKGKSFAFGDAHSTTGRYLAQDLLLGARVRAEDLGSMGYLGRHDKVALSVMLGDYDAGALKKSTLKKVDPEGRLRVLAEFETVTKPWIARAGLEPALVRAVSKGLIGIADEEALEALGVSGFLATSDKEYDFIRKAMKRSREFEGLDKQEPRR